MRTLSTHLTAAARAAVFSLTAATALLAQVTPGPSQPGTAQPYPSDSPDVLMYGAATGQNQAPRSRVQVFGFPTPGASIDLQVVGARPFTTATFVVGTQWLDLDIAGVGKLLVDPAGAAMFQATTDANGSATVPITVPVGTAVGTEFFVQCRTVDSGANSQTELSSAAAIEVGKAAKPIGMTSTLVGTTTIDLPAGITVTTTTDGLLVTETRNAAGAVRGEVALHAESDPFTISGITFTDLHICPGANKTTVPWQANDYLTVPAGTAEEYVLSYSVLGVAYGPYTVSGTYQLSLGHAVIEIAAMPVFDGHPMAGATIHYSLDGALFSTEYLAQLDSLGLPLTISAGQALTDADVAPVFDAMRNAFAGRRAQLVNRAFLRGELPEYDDFLAREAAALLVVTNGMASNDTELQGLVTSGLVSLDDGLLDLIFSKICALLDITDDLIELKEIFKEECGDLVNQAKKQLKDGKYKKAAKTCGKILEKMAGKKFLEKVGDRLGSTVLKKLAKQIGARCLPFIGWAWTIGDLIITLIEQWLDE